MSTTNLPFVPNGNIGGQHQINELRFAIENLKGEFEEFKKSQNISVVSTYNGMTIAAAYRHMTGRYYKMEHVTISNISNIQIGNRTLIAEYEKPTDDAIILAPVSINKIDASTGAGTDAAYLGIYLVGNEILATYSKVNQKYSLNGSVTVIF